jgi:hypothetical protein
LLVRHSLKSEAWIGRIPSYGGAWGGFKNTTNHLNIKILLIHNYLLLIPANSMRSLRYRS